MLNKGLLTSDTVEWETPQTFFDEFNKQFHFTLDVCATSSNAKCEKYFTKKENGLMQTWSGVCWMNPPYGPEIVDWMKKAYESSLRGTTVVCLVPSRTDTEWWHDYAMKGKIVFIRGRLRFNNKGSAPFPSAVVIFRGQNGV